MVELVDTMDLKSIRPKGRCRFDSCLRHNDISQQEFFDNIPNLICDEKVYRTILFYDSGLIHRQ